ncbi:MAG: STAS domain-containing protein [Ignavibacteriaceae bacterium]|jgi:anti-anti-sigma factor
MDEFKLEMTNDILVVKVDILIATHRDAKPLWDEFENHLLFNREKIIIDLSYCNNVDSTFVGMIVKIFRKVKEKNGKMKLVFPQETNADVLQLTGIHKIIECFTSLDEALKSFG